MCSSDITSGIRWVLSIDAIRFFISQTKCEKLRNGIKSLHVYCGTPVVKLAKIRQETHFYVQEMCQVQLDEICSMIPSAFSFKVWTMC
jgi:hypothetical protein